MKVFQINVTANWGSTGRIAEQINNKAQINGWETYIAYGRYANSCTSNLIKIGGKLSIAEHFIESRLLDRHGLASRWATKKLIREIELIKPDIIHLHNIHGYYLNYPILFEYLKKTDIPVVWTLHDCWAFTGHCSFFETVECERWQTGCHNCPLKTKEYPISWGLDRSKKNYALKRETFLGMKNLTLVPVSKWLVELVQKSFLGNYPIHCIYNGIDLQSFNPIKGREELCKQLGLDSNKQIILGVASIWGQRKGLDDFIKLYDMLANNMIIVLVGVTEKQRTTLPNNIIGISRTNNVQELAKLYTAADVYVNPTYADTFPTTNLESLACGTPVITYRTGGSPEAIDEKTGIVVEKGDVRGLANAVIQICKKEKENLTNACRKRAEVCFNKNDRFLDYINLYNRVLSK